MSSYSYTYDLASTILQAIKAIPQASATDYPPLLHPMVLALAATHSYRVVTLTTRIQPNDIRLWRRETICVRRGTTMEFYTIRRGATVDDAGDGAIIETLDATYVRPGHETEWRKLVTTALSEAEAARLLQELNVMVRWTAVGDDELYGWPCVGYEAMGLGMGNGQHEQATLWLSRESLRPIEMRALSVPSGLADATAKASSHAALQVAHTQVTTWGEWDDPSLTIPHA